MQAAAGAFRKKLTHGMTTVHNSGQDHGRRCQKLHAHITVYQWILEWITQALTRWAYLPERGRRLVHTSWRKDDATRLIRLELHSGLGSNFNSNGPISTNHCCSRIVENVRRGS